LPHDGLCPTEAKCGTIPFLEVAHETEKLAGTIVNTRVVRELRWLRIFIGGHKFS
jgi:hypothetical protein